jgi:hypothetical protein
MGTNPPIVKAFVLCSGFADTPGGVDQKDLHGAGLSYLRVRAPFPSRKGFSVYIELSDCKTTGIIQLALMRADSGRRLFFWRTQIEEVDRLRNSVIALQVSDVVFPSAGVYFVELWYDGMWQIDQRIEVS